MTTNEIIVGMGATHIFGNDLSPYVITKVERDDAGRIKAVKARRVEIRREPGQPYGHAGFDLTRPYGPAERFTAKDGRFVNLWDMTLIVGEARAYLDPPVGSGNFATGTRI